VQKVCRRRVDQLRWQTFCTRLFACFSPDRPTTREPAAPPLVFSASALSLPAIYSAPAARSRLSSSEHRHPDHIRRLRFCQPRSTHMHVLPFSSSRLRFPFKIANPPRNLDHPRTHTTRRLSVFATISRSLPNKSNALRAQGPSDLVFLTTSSCVFPYRSVLRSEIVNIAQKPPKGKA
jgi:hypothetical protein